MSFWRRQFRGFHDDQIVNDSEISDGNLHYVVEKAKNDSPPAYQEATGAPVEVSSPLGYSVGPVTIIFLNVSKMIGTGVFSTPSAILNGTGSVGLSMIYWCLGFVTSTASMSVYLEYAAYFPNRSGSEVVYLEQAFPRPRWLLSTTFALQNVLFSFSSGNSIVLAEYLFRCNGHSPTNWELKGVAVAGYTVALILVLFNTRFSYQMSNAIGIAKVLTLIFISIAGWVVFSGHTRVSNPLANFEHPFEGKATPYGLTNALYKVIFSYGGYENAFNVVNEVKHPIKQIRRNGFIALVIVTLLYIFANLAFFAAVPKDIIKNSNQVTASLFFEAVFGQRTGLKGLNFLVALSSFGNLVAIYLGTSRMIRECGRQGVLPFPRFWSSTKPFGTPLGPYLVMWTLTILMILAPPAGDAFNFITDLQIYPGSFFLFLMASGIYLIRWRRRNLRLPRPSFRAWDAVVVLAILVQLYLLVMPWYPPIGGADGGDVSFWYATYVVTGIGILLFCAVYYWAWSWLLPRIGGYRMRQEVLTWENGAQSHRVVKVSVDELARWDATHDSVGHASPEFQVHEEGGQKELV